MAHVGSVRHVSSCCSMGIFDCVSSGSLLAACRMLTFGVWDILSKVCMIFVVTCGMFLVGCGILHCGMRIFHLQCVVSLLWYAGSFSCVMPGCWCCGTWNLWCGIFVAAGGIFVSACEIISCGMQYLYLQPIRSESWHVGSCCAM